MAELLPYRRARRWTRASDYGVPKRRRGSRAKGGGWRKAARELGPMLWAGPLAIGVAVFLASSPEMRDRASPAEFVQGSDAESASFARCGPFASRQACVIDGDTFWYRGTKVRVAHINTPETSDPKCQAEASLGAKATVRLTQLLNAGPFTLEPVDRSHDQYGRALFVVTRGGASVGDTLVAEGLAEEWRGYRREWC